MFEHTADELFAIISGNYESDYKCSVINELKAHIKRDFVDLSEVPRYFEALKVGNKSQDYKLASLAFSSTCHLIKRVGMQDPNALRGPSKIVLPVLLSRLLDQKSIFQQQAKSALETFWLATPTIVESYIRDNALIHSNASIRAEAIVFLSDLIDLNKNFNFAPLLPNLVNLLRDDSVDVVKNVEVLILKYYTLHKGKLTDLVKEFRNQKIESKKAIKLLRDIDAATANSFAAEIRANAAAARPTIDTFSNLAKTKTRTVPNLTSSYQTSSAPVKSSSSSGIKDLSEILADIATSKIDTSLRPVLVNSAGDLHREVESLLGPFTGKETEFNWGAREKNIIRFRGLVVGNADQYPQELVAATRLFHDGINKSILSLRTTLSSNGCQLVKELCAYLTKHLDPIVENMFTPLATLTSATKKIASLNAFGSLSVLLVNTSFNNRLFNHCFTLYQDKNIQPRLYSATFLQIFILKHGSKLDHINFETITKWLTKGVSDPNTTVRESMRTTFWILHSKFPDLSDAVYSKQDTSVKKALERCKPKGIEGPSTGTPAPANKPDIPQFERKRPSVREFIAAKRDRRSTSGPQLTNPTVPSSDANLPTEEPAPTVELGRPTRIGVPQRVRVPSAGSIGASASTTVQPLPKQLSKGPRQEPERQRWPSMGSISRDNTIEMHKPQHTQQEKQDTEQIKSIDVMKKLLSSPLTRERVEGIDTLQRLLLSNSPLPDLTSSLEKLVILDALLLKPVLSNPAFFDLLDITLSIKALAVNKEGVDVLLEKFGDVSVAKGFVSLVNSLDSLQFDSAPSTMFHVKHKSLFFDYSVQNLYRITLGENVQLDTGLLRDIDAAVFPLCISDYPRYDELIVQLHQLNADVFESVLNEGSGYVKAKVSSILDEFKDDIEERALDHTIPVELTMINPFSAKSAPLAQADSGAMEIDEPDAKTKPDFMSDIFSADRASREPTRDFTFVGHDNAVQRQLELDDDAGNFTDSSQEPEPVPLLTHAPSLEPEPLNAGSPFLDDPMGDDDIEKSADEATKNITSQISGIHISPQKEDFRPSTRDSLSDIITKVDPIFNRTKKHIEIYEDAPPVLASEKKLFDFEISRIEQMSDEDATIAQILDLVSKFNNDQITTKEMNCIIKVLHQAIRKEEITAWMKENGFKKILGSIVNYFNSSVNITKDLCFKGLIVMKELLIIDEFLGTVLSLSEVVSIWNILIMVVENLKDFRNAIYVSVDELVDDLIELEVSENKREIMKSCLLNLKDSETTLSTSFLLASLTKCIEQDSLSLEQIKEIDNTVFKFLSHDEVEVRRLTIITYSKCKRKLQEINSNSQVSSMNDSKMKVEGDAHSAERAYNELFAKLSRPQRKLVDYYCDN